MTKSIFGIVAREGIELVKDTGKEMGKQLKRAGNDVIGTFGVHPAESTMSKPDVSTLSKKDNTFKKVEIAQIKKSLMAEQQSAEVQELIRKRKTETTRAEIAERQAERERNKHTQGMPSMHPLDKISSKPARGDLYGYSREKIRKTQ